MSPRVSALLAVLVLACIGAPLTSQQRPARPPDIYFAGTPQPIVDVMLGLADITPGDVVYDLGSGDGRIVILAAQKYGARGVGIEIDPALVARSREIAREAGVEDKVSFIEDDLFTADISAATVVTLWLSPSINAQLEPILKRQLRPGARIVSHQFPIGDWRPDARIQVRDVDVFVWRLPQ
jgi:SAM-dependent methyltransferase